MNALQLHPLFQLITGPCKKPMIAFVAALLLTLCLGNIHPFPILHLDEITAPALASLFPVLKSGLQDPVCATFSVLFLLFVEITLMLTINLAYAMMWYSDEYLKRDRYAPAGRAYLFFMIAAQFAFFAFHF